MKVETIALDSEAIQLLDEEGLPTSDLRSIASLSLLGIRQDGRLLGMVGLEVYKKIGLIRSLVVAPESRGSGLGACLLFEAELLAASQGVSKLYLLTITAVGFFSRLGYERTERKEAPTSIATTTEFRKLCPASAILMRKELTHSINPIDIDAERAAILSDVFMSSASILALTIFHHAYGAVIYETPFRLDIAWFATSILCVILASYFIYCADRESAVGKGSLYVFLFVTLFIAIVTFGLVEGGFNHFVKNVLYFSGVQRPTLDQLYSTEYEIPNDIWFEGTGMLKLIISLYSLRQIIKLWALRKSGPRNFSSMS